MEITDDLVQQSKSDGVKDIFLRDGSLRGFGVRISRSNRKTFIVETRIYGDESSNSARRVTIGSYPEMSISTARKMAAKLLMQMRKGRDPRRLA